MSDLFISPFHPANRKPDLVCPITPYQQKSNELPALDTQTTITFYTKTGQIKEYPRGNLGAFRYFA